jgi:glycosyltransferase involved in cell wall biosynthesis
VIVHEIPSALPGVRRELDAERLVAVVARETSDMPRAWHQLLADVDEVWVPCEWNRRVLSASGLRAPVRSVPHPVELGVDRPSAPVALPLALDDDVFVCWSLMGWCARKAPDLTVEAFCRAFRGDDPVVLVVKTGYWAWGIEVDPAAPDRHRGATWWELQRLLARHRDPPRVVLATDHWTAEQVRAVHVRADCYLSLTRAEGWGLGAFDAAALATPVVMTGYGGQLDFLGDDHPGLVPHREVPVDFPTMEGWFEPHMRWAEPDVDAAAELLRGIFVDRDHPCRLRAPALAATLAERYAPARVGALARGFLEAR